jgi:putative flippase GtrA
VWLLPEMRPMISTLKFVGLGRGSGWAGDHSVPTGDRQRGHRSTCHKGSTGINRSAKPEGNVVEVACTSLAVAASPVEVPGSWRRRLRLRHPLLVQLVRYAVVGGLGTLVNAAVFLLLRTWLDAVPANLVAIVVSTAVSTEANRRFTFGGAVVHRWRANVQNGGTVLFYAFYSSAVLLLLGLVVASPTPVEETLAVAVASVLGGFGRFLVLRYWVFGADEHDHAGPGTVITWDESAPNGRSRRYSRQRPSS